MSETIRTKNLGGLYDLGPVDWTSVTTRLAAGLTLAPGTGGPDRCSAWLSTLNPDGSPHLNGLGVVWHRDTFWFQTGLGSRKGRNLVRDPRCSLSVAVQEFDLVVEGRAVLVEDPDVVAELAGVWSAEDGWPARPDETGRALTAEYSAPSAGPPPWHVFRVEMTAAHALQTVEPYGATRWELGQ